MSDDRHSTPGRPTRRGFLTAVGASAVAATLGRRAAGAPARQEAPGRPPGKSWDVAVIGAGCFGAWTAWHLRQAGRSVLLVDKYGPANARASSAGESRVIRMAYGPDEVYTRSSHRSLERWKSFFAKVGRPELFRRTGVLWMARADDRQAQASLATLAKVGVVHERLDSDEIARRFPQIAGIPGGWAIFEPESAALLARRAVQSVVEDAVRSGVELRMEAVRPPIGEGTLAELKTGSGEPVRAGTFVFACGPWLGKVLPEVLGQRIFPTRQEVFFFGVPPGDARFASPAMPTWIDYAQDFYGLPDIESRGFKVASDAHGEPVDPDTAERVPTPAKAAGARAFVQERFPALQGAPVVEARVCQ
jgi:glycine/D-amino acid oxidase-like deaminating enzyme